MDEPFLRIPPFPGHRASPLATAGSTPLATEEAAEIARLLRDRRVGGNFWGSQPNLPAGRDLILAPASQAQALQMLEAAAEEQLLDRCILIDSVGLGQIGNAAPTITGNIDRWYIAEAASFIWADANHELALLAALCGSPIKLFSNGVVTDVADDQALAPWVGNAIGGWAYESPFDGRSITPFEAIELLSDWRRLIDRNRAISHVFGVAIWKRATVDPMLWNGTSLPRHSSEVPKSWAKGAVVAAWKSRTSQNLLNRVQISGLPVAEIEDGMIRGRGLGANCIPPLSIVVDFAGIYFDPAQPSDLEQLLETVDISEELADRAARLSRMIVDAGVSKYDSGSRQILRCSSVRRVLVLGQVEDDRSVLNGGPGQTNLGLLMQARKLEPDAWLVYRPHPDVEAGHRKGHVADAHILRFADEIERDSSITSLLDSVDGVHCITSLGGFEALLRGKDVTTHGVPFYAGWGLTNDLGPIPLRRRRRRNLDELVAATLILYPTYLDPVTRLPCSPETLVGRMADGEDGLEAPLAWLRSSQGRLKVALRRLWEAAE